MPQARDEVSNAQNAIFLRGTDVGMLARQLFPGGIDASPEDAFHFQQSVFDTAQYIQQGHKIVHEAAFQYDGLLAAMDILVRQNGKWFAYEVKSSTQVKEPFITDAALQYHIITNAGQPLEDIFIVHLNTKYIRQDELDLDQLFIKTSIKRQVLELQSTIAAKAIELKSVLQLSQAPAIVPSAHCNKPYSCDFIGHCTKDEEAEEPNYGKEQVMKDEIKGFLQHLQYPLYYMDFETYMLPVPEFAGHWSYRQVPFQFSLHIQQQYAASLQHRYFLGASGEDPCRQFTEELLSALGKSGTVLVYNKAFENTRLNELKRQFPEHYSAIEAVQARLLDLMVPFRRKHLYTPEMLGSYSIKYVLPALVPEMRYDTLAISNGGDASAAFYNLRFETNQDKIRETREALLEYCGQDTLAMVKVLEKLHTI